MTEKLTKVYPKLELPVKHAAMNDILPGGYP